MPERVDILAFTFKSLVNLGKNCPTQEKFQSKRNNESQITNEFPYQYFFGATLLEKLWFSHICPIGGRYSEMFLGRTELRKGGGCTDFVYLRANRNVKTKTDKRAKSN